MLALAFLAFAGGTVLLVAGVTGSTVASAATGHPDHAKAAPQLEADTATAAASSGSASTPAGPAAQTSGPAGQVVFDYLSPRVGSIAAAGIIGNLQQESSLDPKAPGGGLAQWIGDRWAGLERFAHGQGSSPDSAALQVEYLWHELTTSERGTLLALQKATTPQQAARIFSERFERPGEPMNSNRERYAQQALQTYAKGR